MTERIDGALRTITFEVANLKATHRAEIERLTTITPTAVDAALDAFWPGMDWRSMEPPFLEQVRSDMRDAVVMAVAVMQRGQGDD